MLSTRRRPIAASSNQRAGGSRGRRRSHAPSNPRAPRPPQIIAPRMTRSAHPPVAFILSLLALRPFSPSPFLLVAWAWLGAGWGGARVLRCNLQGRRRRARDQASDKPRPMYPYLSHWAGVRGRACLFAPSGLEHSSGHLSAGTGSGGDGGGRSATQAGGRKGGRGCAEPAAADTRTGRRANYFGRTGGHAAAGGAGLTGLGEGRVGGFCWSIDGGSGLRAGGVNRLGRDDEGGCARTPNASYHYCTR